MTDVLKEIIGDKDENTAPTRDGELTDKEIGATDFKHFALTYFPHIFTKPLSRFHREMFADAQQMILGDKFSQHFLFGQHLVVSVNHVLFRSSFLCGVSVISTGITLS